MYDKNQCSISGKVTNIIQFKDKKSDDAINLSVTSTNKYSDILSCSIYGSLAREVIKSLKVDDNVIIIGRLMSFLSKDNRTSSMKIIVEKIGIEIVSDNI
jgi:single-stranded DNA-binding protein